MKLGPALTLGQKLIIYLFIYFIMPLSVAGCVGRGRPRKNWSEMVDEDMRDFVATTSAMLSISQCGERP